MASNGDLIDASVFNHHHFNKKVYSGFQTVNLQTDFWNPTLVQVGDFLQHGQTTANGCVQQRCTAAPPEYHCKCLYNMYPAIMLKRLVLNTSAGRRFVLLSFLGNSRLANYQTDFNFSYFLTVDYFFFKASKQISFVCVFYSIITCQQFNNFNSRIYF